MILTGHASSSRVCCDLYYTFDGLACSLPLHRLFCVFGYIFKCPIDTSFVCLHCIIYYFSALLLLYLRCFLLCLGLISVYLCCFFTAYPFCFHCICFRLYYNLRYVFTTPLLSPLPFLYCFFTVSPILLCTERKFRFSTISCFRSGLG